MTPSRTTYNRLSLKLAAKLIPVAALLTGDAEAAGLPTMQAPSRGEGNGIIQTLQNYGYDISLLVALLVMVVMFIGVCYHAYNSYSEIHTGRKTWGEFGLTVSVGAVLLVLAIWLLTNATGVL
jgi:integrating conjugative element membrane protein (TIGR03745 family)